MAGSINKIILVGNLGKDPEIRYSQDGGKIASFSVATSETWKDKSTGEKRDNTQWHRVVVFNDNLADVVERYVKKGTKLYLEGALQYRKYTDRDGMERNISEVVINRFKGELQILDSRRNDDNFSSDDNFYNNQPSSNNSDVKKPQSETSKSSSDNSFEQDLEDDIPF